MTWKKLLSSKLFLVVLIAFLISFAFLLTQELRKRYVIEEEISKLQSQVDEIEKEKSRLASLIEYFQSSSYQEKEARKKLNLQKPGEHVVVLPQKEGVNNATSFETKADETPNWKKWWNYFFDI